MLPTPAIRFWSSSIALIGARQRVASAYRCSPVNSGSNGSTPSRAAKNASQRLVAERELAGAEAPRVDELQLGVAEVEGHARVRRALGRVCSSSVPVIRRCSIR